MPPNVPPTSVPTKSPKARRVRVHHRMSQPVRKRLAEYCAATGRPESAIIEQAVDQFLSDGRTSASASSRALDRLVQAIDRDHELRDKQHHDVERLAKAFEQFIHRFANEPPRPQAEPPTVRRTEQAPAQPPAAPAVTNPPSPPNSHGWKGWFPGSK